MFIPIYTSENTTPWIVQANAAAVEKYNTPGEQQAFIAGAKWERGDDIPTWQKLVAIIVVGWMLLNLCFLVIGIFTTANNAPNRYDSKLGGKWDYLLPGYCAGYKFGEFMGDKK
jgi:hypothetical protein